MHSALDDIPGIGEKRRKSLLKTFGSIGKIGQATIEELAAAAGMNKKTAEAVLKVLSGTEIEK